MNRHRSYLPLTIAVALAVAAPPTAAAAGTTWHPAVETVAAFDAAAGETPEGIVIDRHGVIYTGFAQTGEIRRIDPDGSQHTHAAIDTAGGLLLGLAAGRHGELLAAVRGGGGDPAANGIWRVTPDGSASLWVPIDPAGQPNGIATDRHGTAYVGDSLLGVVWRIGPDGELDHWAAGPLLAGDPDAGFPGVAFGANGVVVHRGSVWVANTDLGSVVRIPVRPGGSAGTPRRYVSAPALLGADDLAFDLLGNLYVSTDGLGDSLVLVTPWRSVHPIATADDGLDFPAGIAFGRGACPANRLFVANLGLNAGRAAVLAIRVPFPGWPF